MKVINFAIFTFLLGFIVIFSACSKTNSSSGGSTANNPPATNNPPTTPEPPQKLIRSITTTYSTGDKYYDSLVYDVGKRVITKMSQYSNSIPNYPVISETYRFSYNGTDTVPNRYDYDYTNTSIVNNGTPTVFSASYLVYYDAQNRFSMDSSINAVSSPYFRRIRTLSYTNNMVIRKSIFAVDTASNWLDSAFLDNNRNVVKRIGGHLGKNDQYFPRTLINVEYGSSPLPYGSRMASKATGLINAAFAGSNLQIKSNITSYNSNGTVTTSGATFQYTYDTNGLLIKIAGTPIAGSASYASSVTEYAYY